MKTDSSGPHGTAETYTEKELAILRQVSAKNDVPEDALLDLVNLELAFHKMGRRRGLFPAIREVVSRVAQAE